MKSARPLLITLGVVVLAGAVALGCALTPSFQRWAVLRAFTGRPGLKVTAAEISAGFSGLSLRGVRVEKNGLSVALEHLDASCSLWQLLLARRLEVRQLTAGGIVVDASRLARIRTQAAAVGAPAAAPGLLSRIELPFALVLEDCRVEGRALLPGAPGKPPIEADYKITGGKFAPGQEGALLLAATVRDPAAGASVAALNAQVSLRATQTTPRTFGRVVLTAVVDAEGRNLSDKNQLKISAAVIRETAGENYSLSADTLLQGKAEQMLTLHAGLTADGKQYAGNWTLNARTAQVEPFFLGGALPEFNAHGEGLFAFTPATRAMALQGRLQAAASRLESLKPAWRAIGAVQLKARFDVDVADNVARLRQLELQLAGDGPVLELQAASAAEFNFKERRLQVGQAASGEILQVKLPGLPLAWVRPFIPTVDVSGGPITGAFSVTAEKDNLHLRATAPLHFEALTVAAGDQLLLNKADISLLADAFLRANELEVKISGLALKTPAGDSLSAGLTAMLPLQSLPTVAVSAGFTGDLPGLIAPWLPLGHVKTAGDLDFTAGGDRLELRRADVSVSDPAGRRLIRLTALRPAVFDLAKRRVAPGEKGVADLLRLTLDGVPLDQMPWPQSGARLGGRVTQGEFVLTAEGEKLNLHATAPLKLTGVSLTQAGRPALTGLAIDLLPTLELNGKSTAAQSGETTVRNADGALLASIKADATQSPEGGQRGALTFNLEVPALAAQPLFAGAQAVSAGRASGEVRVAVGAASQMEARMTVNGLVGRDSAQTLPVANLSFRAVGQEDGKISVQAPLLLDRAGLRSDLNFSLDLTPAGRGYALDGKLTGEHVELADARAVLGVFLLAAAPDAEEPAAPTMAAAKESPVTPDTQAAWSRFKGQLMLDVKSVTRGNDWAMTGLTGLVTVDPARLSLEKLEAAFGEKGRLTTKADLHFTGGEQPYQLGGDFSLTEFDAGRLFKALEPGRPATVEGIFAVTGHFAGQGATLGEAAERTRGRFELTSRQGIFRGLQRTSSKLSVATKAVELGASVLGSLFGSDKVTKAAEKVVGTAYFVDQLAQSIGEFNYDLLNARLVRDETLNLALNDISLVSAEIRLNGSGTVTYVAGKPLLEQPLNATLTFSGCGKVEQLLGKLRLLDGTRDELGYAKTQMPVTLGGSLAKPDPSAFFTKIASAKLGELLAPEN